MNIMKLLPKTIQVDVFPAPVFASVGLRMNKENFLMPHYIESIIQALIFSVNMKSASVIVAGDGRTGTRDAITRATYVLAANSVSRVIIPLKGYTSMTGVTCLMREEHCHFGFIFGGGHLPATGCDSCLGLKVLSAPGIPIRAEVTVWATRLLRIIESYKMCEDVAIDFDTLSKKEYEVCQKPFSVEVVDVTDICVGEIRKMFDFLSMKKHLPNDIRIAISCSHGVAGPIALNIFVKELRFPRYSILKKTPLQDYGDLSPDPSPINQQYFFEHLQEESCQFGAVISADGCRCMIIGEEGFFVSPSDALAVIATHSECIPLFKENPLSLIIRSVCTSRAVDRVAEESSLMCWEVLPGWKNFSCAMLPPKDASVLFGEESFGIGASTVNFSSDRDGVWATLAWLAIMAQTGKSVRMLVEEHWKMFGRFVFGRLDFTNIPTSALEEVMSYFRDKSTLRFEKIKSGNFANIEYIDPIGIDPKLQTKEAKKRNTEVVFDVENYVQPYGFIKKTLISDKTNEVYQISMTENARLIIRKSESCENASILRFYIEYRMEPNDPDLLADREEILKPFIKAAMKITKINDFIGNDIFPVFI